MHLCTKFQVYMSTRVGDTLGSTPKIWGSRDLGLDPFLNFSLRVFEILPCASVYQISSLYLYSFLIYVRVYAKNSLGHVT